MAITCRRYTHAYTLQLSFCKVGYRPVSVQCLNSTQDNTKLMMVLEAVMMDVTSGIDGILTEQKCISVLFREVFSQSYISFFHLLVNGFVLSESVVALSM